MAIRNYSSVAVQTTLVSGIGPSDTTAQLVTAAGLPAPPFTLALDYNGSTEELVDVTNISGTNITAMTRAVDGTSAASHNPGSVVRHVSSARDFTEANTHINSNTGVHGIAGAVVGTTDTQTISNKTLSGPVFTGTSTGINPIFQMNPMLVQPTAAGNLPFVVRGLASQTGDLMAAQDSALTRLWTVKSDGTTVITPTGTAANQRYLQVNVPSGAPANGSLLNLQKNAVTVYDFPVNGGIVENLQTTGLTGLTITGPVGYNGTFVQLVNNASTVLTIDSTGAISAGNLSNAATSYSPTIAGGALTIGNGTITGFFSFSGKQCTAVVNITAGSTTTLAATGSLSVSLPFTSASTGITSLGSGYFTTTSGGTVHQALVSNSSSSSSMVFFPCVSQASGTIVNNSSFNTATTGITITTGAVIQMTLSYLIA